MADIKVLESKEVWSAITTEYELDIDGEITSIRIAENPKNTEFFEWNEISGWEESDIDDGLMKIVYEAWSNGELE
mgnify:CR=1 FL=1|jgi:hypothetical protein|tara:strand:+ start:485 stop:709 length:225 start_codon:yes stop_codon:yes gene_type:complete